MRKWFLHSYEVADNILYLIPAWKFFCSFGLISATRKFGEYALDNTKGLRYS